MPNFTEAIIRKRDGGALDRDQVESFVSGAADGSLPPEQLASMLMAICLRGMDPDETTWLTSAMLDSGESWSLSDGLSGVVDKHSTGGVGDTVSLVIAPLLAAVGAPVAMLAGRGLGHSQGTLDKLEGIPGFRCEWSRDQALGLLDSCGAALVAQSDNIAPADRVLYALRDVTGTVPSLPLIVASIMSKKLAIGAAALVLDVKWGTGAFRHTVAEATELADALRAVARGMGLPCEALVTDMNQPLGCALGTACELRAARQVLEGGGSAPLREVTLRLAATVLGLAGRAEDEVAPVLERALADGSALAAWERIVEAHGGDPNPDVLAQPSSEQIVTTERGGVVASVDAAALGWVATDLGAGRRHRDEAIDHGAGLLVHARIGDTVEPGQPLATILVGERPVDLEAIETRVAAAFEISDEQVEPPQLILGTVEQVEEAGGE
jgi:pyrimidine-nucleoside phosphorylase